ncbi:MAG TPA: chemotaxis protein CheR [Bacteroidales bacterium]|nr:chemotaxis protein CheR [Bacteroidales bacterium]
MVSKKDFYVVGIGASAGGLEAIETFFTKVPADSGLAFVIVQHLSPDYKSLMPEILNKRTNLNVLTAEDGMLVEPNNIYLIPRKMNMKIFHSKLQLTEKVTINVLNLPIDIFLHSLAEDFEDKAIAVILSGTGSDGSRGIRVIKENGGIIFAQDPDSAKFDGMPKSAVTTGTVDFILPPQEIPEKIISYVKHPFIQAKDKYSDLTSVPDDYMAKINLLLKENFGLDFTYYKESTISRRIERRLSINQIDNLKDYITYLFSSKNEQKTLYNELLIGVTKFFRDTEAFQIVEKEIIPAIFASKTATDEIRVWVTACSTGEEAYSIAILFKEYMLANELENEIKIFATDVDRNATEYAGQGIYSASIMADVSPERLKRFFTPMGDSFRITEEIRAMLVFANHNLIKDPPFNKIDFLSCRNLLIYFQTALQQKVLSFFNFALSKTGYLFLGSSETIGEMEHFYETVNLKWKFFKSKRSGKLPIETLVPKFPSGLLHTSPVRKPVYTLKTSVADMASIFADKILEDNAPETVIVNENYEIINSFGDPNKYLVFPRTKSITEGFEYVVTKMVPSNLKLTFSIAINKALKTLQEVVHHNVKYQKNEKETYIVDLRFVPLQHNDLNDKFVIIYFIQKPELTGIPAEVKTFEEIDTQAQQRIFDLENELKHTKENLQASIEELETTNEELQSTNEELISSNEELQSTNEELQSVNEELYTVNTEFQVKNHDLMVANNDMENLLQNSEVSIVFLDIDLKIRKFTENTTEIFNLKKSDIGRPILDLTHHIKDTYLLPKVQRVLKNHEVISKTVQVKDKWFRMKVLPYLTQKGYLDGVVLSFIDITEFFQVQTELKISEEKFRLLFEFLPVGITISDSSGKIISSNKAAEELLGLGKAEQLKRSIDGSEWQIIRKDGTLLPSEEYASVRAIKEQRQIHNVQMGIVKANEEVTWIVVNAVPTNIEGFELAISYLNITELVQIEQELQETTLLYRSLFQNMNRGFALHQMVYNETGNAVDYKFIDINETFEAILGMKREVVVGKTVKQLIPNIEAQWIEKYAKVANNGGSIVFEQASEALGKRFKVNAYSPQKGQFATLFEEIE